MRNNTLSSQTIWACGIMAALSVLLFYAAAQKLPHTLTPLQYDMRIEDYTNSNLHPPQLPDLSIYTVEKIRTKIPPLQSGSVKIDPMVGPLGLEKFVEPKYFANYITRQNRPDPVAIHIESGVYTLESLTLAVNNPTYLSKDGNTYTLRLPIHIDTHAALIIDTPNTVLRMSQNKGAFIANSGLFFMIDGQLAGWNESQNSYAIFKAKKEFRPFFSSWSGSQAYFARSKIMHLGFASSKAYGITYSASAPMLDVQPNRAPPTGWIISSLIEGLYYGFYSYEADDIVLLDNEFRKNIIYAIDPHDRSERLIIARNLVTESLKKHGIILSREVNNSFIIHNKIYNNHGAGIMLDRDCRNTIIAYNESNGNSDGITIFESPHAYLYKNWVSKNRKTGIRIRNSQNITALDNTVTENLGTGVKVYTQQLGLTDYGEPRDLLMDPYTLSASLIIEGGSINLNQSGSLRVVDANVLDIRNVNVLTEKGFLQSPLNTFNAQAFQAMKQGNKRVIITGTR